MISLLWIAFLATFLGGYGLWRGFSRDICLSVMLIALGVASAALIIISTPISLVLAGIVVVISLSLGVWEGQRGDLRPRQGRARRRPVTSFMPVLPGLWQEGVRMRRAPRQGATPRKRSRHPF